MGLLALCYHGKPNEQLDQVMGVKAATYVLSNKWITIIKQRGRVPYLKRRKEPSHDHFVVFLFLKTYQEILYSALPVGL